MRVAGQKTAIRHVKNETIKNNYWDEANIMKKAADSTDKVMHMNGVIYK